MQTKKADFSTLAVVLMSLAVVATAVPAAAQGSQGEMFRRHFWRGQAYHGEGYAAQAHEMGRGPQRSASGPASLEAMVEEGTPGAAIARSAASCAARFKSYDASKGTYVGRGGRLYRCP